MKNIFGQLVEKEHVAIDLDHILPKVLVAGKEAGKLSESGAYLIDPTGNLKPGIPICPPEGDAGTGMVATNSVAKAQGLLPAEVTKVGVSTMKRQTSFLQIGAMVCTDGRYDQTFLANYLDINVIPQIKIGRAHV